MVKNGNFTFLLLEFILADEVTDLPPSIDLPVDLNADFRFLLLELILADQLADLPPPVVACSGEEWQFHISTVRFHIGRSTGRFTPQYWHLVVKDGNFTFLLLELILADQLTDICPPPVSGM